MAAWCAFGWPGRPKRAAWDQCQHFDPTRETGSLTENAPVGVRSKCSVCSNLRLASALSFHTGPPSNPKRTGATSYLVSSYLPVMPDYEECPFCELVIEVPSRPRSAFGESRHASMLEDHIRRHHDKVQVRKGSNYRWEDAAGMATRASLNPPSRGRPSK